MRLAFAILLLSLPLQGQAVLKGKFIRNQEGGQPVVGVNVRAAGSNPDVSKNPYGDFVLKFPSKKPGDKVTLTVSFAGLVLVNWVQLDAILPGDADANELTLFMAREPEREEMARRFFKLKSFDAIDANYKRLLADANQVTRRDSHRMIGTHLEVGAGAAAVVAKEVLAALARDRRVRVGEPGVLLERDVGVDATDRRRARRLDVELAGLDPRLRHEHERSA